jgi:hypothetical protein
MMKRPNQSSTTSEKTPAESPYPRDKKQNRSKSTSEVMATKDSETAEPNKELENHDKRIEQNLIDKFTNVVALASKNDMSAESKPGDVCGGGATFRFLPVQTKT